MSELLRRMQQASASKSAAAEKAATEVQAVRDEILAGQSAGDPILDYVLFRYGEENSRSLERLRMVEEALTGSSGELILIDYTEKVRIRHSLTGEPSPSDYQNVERACLAILDGDALVVERNDKTVTCRLPVTKYLQTRGNKHDKPVVGHIIEQDLVGFGDYALRDFWVAEDPHAAGLSQFLLTVGDEPTVQRLTEVRMCYPWKPDQEPEKFRLALERLGRLSLVAE